MANDQRVEFDSWTKTLPAWPTAFDAWQEAFCRHAGALEQARLIEELVRDSQRDEISIFRDTDGWWVTVEQLGGRCFNGATILDCLQRAVVAKRGTIQ